MNPQKRILFHKNDIKKKKNQLLYFVLHRLRVTFGVGARLLHHIEPFQFIDSPEWYMMQNAFPQDGKACKPQVKAH